MRVCVQSVAVTLGAVLIAGGLPRSIHAQRPGTRISQRFAELDRDDSGSLSPDEAGRTELEFRAMDADRDGAITLSEATDYFRRQTTNRFRAQAAGGKRLTPRSEPVEIFGALSASMPVTRKSCVAAAEYSRRANGHAVLVMFEGKVVYESYDNGWDAKTPHRLASGTKSFAGVAAAAAQQDGLLRLDEKVSETITEWKADPQKSNITIAELLSLTSGIDPGENSIVLPYREAILAKSLHPPGAKFQYGPNPFQTFGELMRRKLEGGDGTYLDYLKRRVLDPINVRIGHWRMTENGQPHVPSGAFLTARQWASFGEWLRLGGRHDGSSVVDEKWLHELTTGTRANPRYGITFWLGVRGEPAGDDAAGRSTTPSTGRGMPADLFMAAGAGKQRLFVMPSLKLVVVRMGETEGRRFKDDVFLSRLLRVTVSEDGGGL